MFPADQNTFQYSYFPYIIKEWDNLSVEIRKSVSCEFFFQKTLKIRRRIPTSWSMVTNAAKLIKE